MELLFWLLAFLAHRSFSLGDLYCPECHTREGFLDCHPEHHHTCHENEVCQIHAHEDPHGVAMETNCRPEQDCLRDELHEQISCAAGILGAAGPHGCFWCCRTADCFDKYRFILFPGQYSTPNPSPQTTTTAATTLAATQSAVQITPEVQANCYICEKDSTISGCLRKPHNCDLTQEVCMVTFNDGMISAACRSDQFCASQVQSHNTDSCYVGSIGYSDTCTFCCEAPGCMENVLIPKLPSEMTGVLVTVAPPLVTTPRVTTPTPLPTTQSATSAPTTLYPLGPNGEINCHVCEEARSLEECLRHPTYCHTDRNEICLIEYDPKGHVHARCEKDKHVCYDHALHNPQVCLDGTHDHGEHCTYCCDTVACFQASVGNLIPATLPPVQTQFNCHVCEDVNHIDECLRHPTYCDISRNEICLVEYDMHGHVHSRCEKDRKVCEDRQSHNHLSCSAVSVVEGTAGPPGPPGPPGHDHEPCVFCCESTDCFHTSVGSIIGK